MRKIAVVSAILLVVPLVAFATPVPDTGQTKCYNNTQEITCTQYWEPFYGQDAQYVNHPQSYTKLDAGGNDLPDDAAEWAMVRDNVTGLIWEVKQDKDDVQNYANPHDADNRYTWYDSNPATNGGDPSTPGDGTDTEDFINELNTPPGYGGFTDWRMPTVKELSFIRTTDDGFCINLSYFPNTADSWYWSSTTLADPTSPHLAWITGYVNGTVSHYGKSNGVFVRAVRGGQSTQPFTDNGDGTITDTGTGLMWETKTVDNKDERYTWQEGLAYCENLSLAGYDDWRLPDVNELQSLIDYAVLNPAIDPVFQNVVPNRTWSATTGYYDPYINAYYLDFFDGNVALFDKNATHNVRAVRTYDSDIDGIPDTEDNCLNTPNGPSLGTCTEGTVGETCMNNDDCDPNGVCSMNQEDMDLDGAGDVCDDVQMCKGNFDYDGDVDGTDASVFKSHFGRSTFKNPCPPDGPAPVEKTGQATSFGSDDDGVHRTGVSFPEPRFVDKEDGTVRDNLTGLIWLKNADCFGERSWNNALSDCAGLASGFCGLTDGSQAGDWRLPSVREILSICHYGFYDPIVPDTSGLGKWSEGDPFTNLQSSYYWSSTTDACILVNSWSVDMYFGYLHSVNKSTHNVQYVWPVRGGH